MSELTDGKFVEDCAAEEIKNRVEVGDRIEWERSVDYLDTNQIGEVVRTPVWIEEIGDSEIRHEDDMQVRVNLNTERGLEQYTTVSPHRVVRILKE